MKITITNSSDSSSETPESPNLLIPKAKLVEALRSLAERPEENIPFEEVKLALKPFLSNLADKEIYEKTSGYVQILDEVLKQIKQK